MSITTINENFVHYEVIGRGDPLIFVHGFLGSWRYWWPTMQALARHHRSSAFDLWGFGSSGKLPKSYDFESYLAMLPKFIESLGVARPVTLIGHGLGATLVLRYTRLFPLEVEKVVAVSLPANGQLMNDQLKKLDPESFLKRYLGDVAKLPQLYNEVRKSDKLAFHKIVDQLSYYDFTDDLSAIENPLLLIYGRRDSVVRSRGTLDSLLNQHVADHHAIFLDESNHFPMLEQPAIFNRLLLDFLQYGYETHISPKIYWQRRTR